MLNYLVALVTEINASTGSRVYLEEVYMDLLNDTDPSMVDDYTLKQYSGLNGDHLSVAFDVRMYHIEKALLAGAGIKSVSDHVKNVRLIAQYLLTEKASVPQVLKLALISSSYVALDSL